MTETTSPTCHINDLPKKPAATRMCGECPWRASNADRPHPDGDYDRDNSSRRWHSVAVEGDFFGCHLLDGDHQGLSVAEREAGYKQPADIGARRECAGAVAMIQRELRIAQEHPNHATYIKARPVGLSARALRIISARLKGELEPVLRFNPEVDETDLIDLEERVDTTSWAWRLGKHGMTNVLITTETILGTNCNCDVCEHHTEAHPARPLTTTSGDVVDVDAALHPLLTAMNAAGVRTITSCQNLADALEKLAPHKVGQLQGVPTGGMNYRSTILGRLAYIRFDNRSIPAQAFAATAARFPGVEVTTHNITSQLNFPLTTEPALVDLARKLRTVLDEQAKTKRAS